MIKKLIVTICYAAALGAVISFAQTPTPAPPSTEFVVSLPDGLHVGGKATDRIGVYNRAPIAQQANTTTAYNALVNSGWIATGGTDPNTTTYVTPANNPIQHVQVPLTAANLIAMEATPVQLIAAPGAAKTLVVAKVGFRITRTATAFTGGGAVQIQYGNTAANGGVQALDSTIASTVVTGSAGTTDTLRNGQVISDSSALANAGLFITNASAVFATGTGTATVDVWYYVY